MGDTTEKSDKKESVDLSDLPPLECDEEVREGKRLKILTPIPTLPILPAQIKAENNSYKLKNEICQILYSFYQYS